MDADTRKDAEKETPGKNMEGKMKKFYQMKTKEAFEKLDSSIEGISKKEALRRQEKYGKNELPGEDGKSALMIFFGQFADVLVLILIGAALISAFLGDIKSCIVIAAVITMNAILGTIQQKKADHSLESLRELSMPTAKVLRDGNLSVLPCSEVVPGDVVILEAGDYVCADGRLIETAGLKVNESALTGESLCVEKQTGAVAKEVVVGDQNNMVFSGSFVVNGRGKFLVTGIGLDTEVGKIAKLLNDTKQKKTPLQVSMDNFGTYLSIGILVICALIFGLSVLRGEEILNAFIFAIALAVAAIPEALSSIVTIVLAFGTRKMVKEHAIVRKLQAVEGLGSVSVICSDKTGTLTQNKMTVKNFFVNGISRSAGEVHTNNKAERKLLYAGILCNDADNAGGKEIGDPTEVALLNFSNQHRVDSGQIRKKYPRIGEIPFDSDRKLMSVAYGIGSQKYMATKGAVDELLRKTDYIETNGNLRGITDADRRAILRANEEFSKNGLRVLAFATKKIKDEHLSLKDEKHLTFLGMVAMIDPPREEAKEAVEKCVQAGIRPVMITGDHKITAMAIAKELGILHDGLEAVEGRELERMSDRELSERVERTAVYARVSPEHKIRIVRAWQEKGMIVSMTGDGVNDAPALKQADIGVAMGITGTEVAKDAAAMVLTDDNFSTIVKAVETGRNVYNNIKKAIKFLLSGNMAGILTVLYACLAGLPSPFLPVQLLFINLLTDSLPAISLGLDNHTSEVMKERPRPREEGILTRDFMLGILAEGLIIGMNTMIAYYVGLGISSAAACTMAFSTLCLSRLVHGFNSKSDHPLLFQGKMWDNYYLNWAFLTGFAVLNLVLFVPGLKELFGVVPVTLPMLAVIYACSALNLFEIQLLKFIVEKIR